MWYWPRSNIVSFPKGMWSVLLKYMGNEVTFSTVEITFPFAPCCSLIPCILYWKVISPRKIFLLTFRVSRCVNSKPHHFRQDKNEGWKDGSVGKDTGLQLLWSPSPTWWMKKKTPESCFPTFTHVQWYMHTHTYIHTIKK